MKRFATGLGKHDPAQASAGPPAAALGDRDGALAPAMMNGSAGQPPALPA
jgi:hypothetical protein